MTKKRRMPVNALGPAAERPAEDALLDGLISTPAAAPAPAEAPASPPPRADADRADELRLRRAEDTVTAWALAALALGFVPWPLISLLALAGLQVGLARGLAADYGLPRGSVGCAALAGVGVSAVLVWVGHLGVLLLGDLPWLGAVLAFACRALGAAAATFAAGRLFIKHGETGGTLLDLDARTLLAHFRGRYGPGGGASSPEG